MDTSSVPLKRCTKREQCIHPQANNGWLPATSDYFRQRTYKEKPRLESRCRECEKAQGREYNKRPEVVERRRNYWQMPENRARRLELSHTSERMEAHRQRSRKRYATPEYRERSRQRWHTDPEYRAKHSEYHKEYESRPEVKARRRIKRLTVHRERERVWSRQYERSLRRKAYKDRYYRSLEGRLMLTASASRRRARLYALPHTFTTSDWKRALDYFGGCCAICGRPPGLWHRLAHDHWIPITDPREDNPGTVATNILPVCHSLEGGEGGCNNIKSWRDPVEFLETEFGERQAKEILARIHAYFDWVTDCANA